MLKAGIIRCRQTEDMCSGRTDFKIASEGNPAFKGTGPVKITGFVSCGGCPGKRAASRAKMMVERGAKLIFIASCISKGNPIGFHCPHFSEIKACIIKICGGDTEIIDWIH